MKTDLPPFTPPAIQPRNPVALLRALQGPAASCLLALVMGADSALTPATSAWLEHVTGYSANIVSDALRVLLDLGLVQRPNRNDSILLAPGVRQLLVDAGINPPVAPEALPSNLEIAPPPYNPVMEQYPQNLPGNASFRAAAPDSESESLEVEENRSLSPDSDSPDERRNYPIDVPRLLHATAHLFGEPVHGAPERYPDVPLLLATIAKAYDRSSRLRNPARVVYTNLKNGALPAARYRQDPLAYLPADFLRQAGLPEPGLAEQARSPCYGGWTSTPELTDPAGPVTSEPLPHPSTGLPASRNGARSALQVWQSCQTILSGRFHPQTYSRMIGSLRLARYDPAAVAFTFAAADDYQRAWLEQRCTLLFQQVLSGLCDRPVKVKFTIED
jgi:hypothetical protein